MPGKHKLVRKGFTLIELLVVIAVLALLVAISLPSLSRAKELAKVTAVNAELRQIGLCLEMYMEGNDGKHPPTRTDCTMGWEDRQLPPELVEQGYLPPPDPTTGMSAGIEDRFNPGNTYRYCSVGEQYRNGKFMKGLNSFLYIPEGFQRDEGTPQEDVRYSNPATSPVTWVIYSQGPQYDYWESIKTLHGPVPERTWYSSKDRKGLIVRIRLKGKPYEHIGSFE